MTDKDVIRGVTGLFSEIDFKSPDVLEEIITLFVSLLPFSQYPILL